ncbi:MAG: NAD(P)H-dependent oxidoreductase [Anaerovoracaceae bacterium]
MKKEKLLFIDTCISTHDSRTKRLCDTYLEEFTKRHDVDIEVLQLRDNIVTPLTTEAIIERDGYAEQKDFDHSMFDMAKQFKEADYIVIGAPYWDLSFPSILKVYVENIVVADLTFVATASGFVGICNGKLLTYITTAGGFIADKNLGYDYFVGMAEMLGVKETQFFGAEGLDIDGINVEEVMTEAIDEIREKTK